MAWTELTRGIHRLTDDLNVWSSDLCIPLSIWQCLDNGSSAMGDASSTHIGATDQPLKYSPGKNGSLYTFPTAYVGLESWPALILRYWNSQSMVVLYLWDQVPTGNLTCGKCHFHLSCRYCHLYESNSAATFTDNRVGPTNVPYEHLKCVKKSGNNLKDVSFHYTILFLLFPFPSLYSAHIIILLLNRDKRDGLQVQKETL